MPPETHVTANITAPGADNPFAFVREPVPAPGHGELLIEVHAAGVNLADTKQAQGVYDLPPGVTSVPGVEIAGVVTAVGPATSRHSIGDHVCALVAGGGYAEMCIAPEVQCLPIPGGLSMIEAAALPETVFTVWMALFEECELRSGETVLVHGGAGGIGTTAIQMARAAGARVIATAGSDERCQRCVDVGAEFAVNYRAGDFGDAIAARLGERSVDVVLDTVGAPHLESNIRLLALEGRLCFLAGDGGRDLHLDLLPVMQKRLTLTGASLRRRPVLEKGLLARAIEHRVWPWVDRGTLRPSVSLVLPLHEAARAHQQLVGREVQGKAVLTTAASADR